MDIKESVQNQNDVGFRILKWLLEKKVERENMVFSPLSIYMMLTLLAAGASKGQLIHKDLLSFLNFKSIDQLNSFFSELFPSVFGDMSATDGPCVTTANGVWIADYLAVKPSFQNLLQTLYKGKLNHVDFINKSSEVVDEANEWVSKETRGLIPKILDKYNVHQNLKMILANTVYFKAQWLSSQFCDRATKNADFHLLNGSSIRVPFMTSFKNQAISVFDDFKVASLYYRSNFFYDRRQFSMLVFLPNDRDKLRSLIERACSESGFLERHRPRHSVPVAEFKIPKFKFGFGIMEMKQMVEDLGLGSLFSVGSGFTEMVEEPAGREVFVSNMFHKAVICVDENGTEAAAVTVCNASGCCLNTREPINFVADHPFMFVITEDETTTILFIGQVLDPSLSN